VEQLARSDSDDGAALWFLLGAVRQQDAAGGFLFRFERLDNDTIIQRANGVFVFAHVWFLFEVQANGSNPLKSLDALLRVVGLYIMPPMPPIPMSPMPPMPPPMPPIPPMPPP